MNRRQKIIVSITGIFLVLLILVGLTYAYFLTRINGNDNEKSISVTTANLELTYGDGTNKVLTTTDPIIPSNDPIGTKDFTVTNNGNATVNNYAVYLEDIDNKLTRTSDLVYTLTCTSSVQNKTCNGKSETVYPNKNGILVTNNIDKDEVQTYVLTLTYKEMNEDQSTDMNKTINGKIQIYNLKDIVDIEGTVTNALATDYVQINSVEKKSQIINGEYKLPAVEPGTHTIRVFDKDGAEKSSRQITIKKGKTASVSGNTITVTDDSQTISMTLNRTTTSSDSISNEIKDFSPIKKGTLAYTILNNAQTANSSDEIKGTAIYRSTPSDTTTEASLIPAEDDYGTSYYFRGNVKNNYVNFAGMCWRIVRIEGDGSVKLIIQDKNTVCNSDTMFEDWIGSLNIDQEINSEYGSGKVSSYLKTTDVCQGDEVIPGTEKTYDSMGDTYTMGTYSSVKRIIEDKKPTLKCKGSTNNSYRWKLLTADEVYMAMGKSTKNYLQNQSVFPRNLAWQTSTMAISHPEHNFGTIFHVHDDRDGNFTLCKGCTNSGTNGLYRITASILSSVKFSSTGNGTVSNPYIIQ